MKIMRASFEKYLDDLTQNFRLDPILVINTSMNGESKIYTNPTAAYICISMPIIISIRKLAFAYANTDMCV